MDYDLGTEHVVSKVRFDAKSLTKGPRSLESIHGKHVTIHYKIAWVMHQSFDDVCAGRPNCRTLGRLTAPQHHPEIAPESLGERFGYVWLSMHL